MLTNMFYEVPDEVTESVPSKAKFLVDQLDLIGGVQFIFIEVCISFNLNLDIPPIEFIITIILLPPLIENTNSIAFAHK